MGKRSQKTGLLDILFSMLIDPRGVTRQLLNPRSAPPWAITTFLRFLATCVAAPLVYSNLVNVGTVQLQGALPALLATTLTLLCSTFFLSLFLDALAIRRSYYSVFSALSYATAPCTSVLLAMLLVNKATLGNFSLLTSIASGFFNQGEMVAKIFPTISLLSIGLALIVLSQSLRALSNSSLSVSLLLAIFAIPLVLGSYIVALTTTDLFFPRSSETIIRFFSSYLIGQV